jgi:hypothetical protein
MRPAHTSEPMRRASQRVPAWPIAAHRAPSAHRAGQTSAQPDACCRALKRLVRAKTCRSRSRAWQRPPWGRLSSRRCWHAPEVGRRSAVKPFAFDLRAPWVDLVVHQLRLRGLHEPGRRLPAAVVVQSSPAVRPPLRAHNQHRIADRVARLSGRDASNPRGYREIPIPDHLR